MKKISISELSNLTDLDRRTVGRRLGSLSPELGPHRAHLYNSAEALKLLYGFSEDGEQLDLSQERARLAKSQRQLSDLKLRQQENDLIPQEIVLDVWSHAIANAQQRLLSIPTKTAGIVSGLDDPAACAVILKDEIDSALEEVGTAGFPRECLG